MLQVLKILPIAILQLSRFWSCYSPGALQSHQDTSPFFCFVIVMSDVAAIRNTGSKLVGQQVRVDSIAVSLFADIFIELTNTRQDPNNYSDTETRCLV